MKAPARFLTCTVAALLIVGVAPAFAAPVATSRIVACTATRTSVTVRWVTPKTPANRKITGYAIVTHNDLSPKRTFGSNVRVGTVRKLKPRTAYRAALFTFVKGESPSLQTCLTYTKLPSGKATTQMLAPLISAVAVTDTTISVTWSRNETATSELPSSYQVWISPPGANQAATSSMREPSTANSITFTGLDPDTSYYVGIGANDTAGVQVSVLTYTATSPTTVPTTTSTTTVPTTST